MSKEINNKYGSQTKENPREFTKEFTFDDRSVTTIYAKNSGEAESMARINGIKYDFILETKLIK